MTPIPLLLSWLAAVLVAMGMYGALVSRNAVRVLASIELLFNGVVLAVLDLILFSLQVPGAPVLDASMLILFAIILTAVEVAVLAAIIILVFRTKKTVSTRKLAGLKG